MQMRETKDAAEQNHRPDWTELQKPDKTNHNKDLFFEILKDS